MSTSSTPAEEISLRYFDFNFTSLHLRATIFLDAEYHIDAVVLASVNASSFRIYQIRIGNDAVNLSPRFSEIDDF